MDKSPPLRTCSCSLVWQIFKVIKQVGVKRGSDWLFHVKIWNLGLFRSERVQQKLSWGQGLCQGRSKTDHHSQKATAADRWRRTHGGRGRRGLGWHWCAGVSLIQRWVLIQINNSQDDPVGVLVIWWEKRLALHKRRQRFDMVSKAETLAVQQSRSRWSPWVRAWAATRVTEIQIQPTQETNASVAAYKIRSVDVSNCCVSHMNTPFRRVRTLEERLEPVFFPHLRLAWQKMVTWETEMNVKKTPFLCDGKMSPCHLCKWKTKPRVWQFDKGYCFGDSLVRQTNIAAQLEFFIKQMTRNCRQSHLYSWL